jgi:hypothetical protein
MPHGVPPGPGVIAHPALDGGGVAAAAASGDLESVRRFARWLDIVPLDPLLGFIAPGAGDVLGSVFGLYIVGIAVRRRLPGVVVARMLMNLTADAAFGVVPLLGDLIDLGFRANQKNAALLLAHGEGRASTWRDWAVVGGAALGLIAVLTLTVWLTTLLIRAVF